jgi:trehalose synthase
MDEARLVTLPCKDFEQLLTEPGYAAFDSAMTEAARALRGRTMWHINSTLTGGGVAEMLSSMLPYVLDVGVACRWVKADGEADFLDITKRLHNHLHGFTGDDGPLGEPEKQLYQAVLAENADRLTGYIRPGDVVFLHDPQTAGLIPALKARGAKVIWHCHIGADEPNDLTRLAWDFLRDEVAQADRYVFSRPQYLWEGLDSGQLKVIQPSINPLSAKNRPLRTGEVGSILRTAGVLAGEARADGVPAKAKMVMQTARWDRLKDQRGVLELFASQLAQARPDVHLVVAGPSTDGVSDDPEGAEVFAECVEYHKSLPREVRARAHLVSTSMRDPVRAEVIVNALQRRADVVMQKSLAEGFGLVVAEAMWKKRPVVASGVGGIQDQIEDGVSGLLVADPDDGPTFAKQTATLLDDPQRANEMGQRAHERVRDHFLTPRQLTETMRLVVELAL